MNTKKLARRMLAGLLCFALCMSLCMPVFAADANSVSISLDKTTISKSETTQPVILTIAANGVSIDSLTYTVELPAGWSVESLEVPSDITGHSWTNNKLTWYWTGDVGTNLDNVTNLGVVTISVPAGAVVGEYEIKVTGFDASANTAYWAEQATYSTKLTIEEPKVEGYTAGLTAADSVTVGEKITVNVGVAHSSDELYNAGAVKLTYDSTKLTYDNTSLASSLKVTNNTTTPTASVLTIEDYGVDKTIGETITSHYSPKFTALEAGAGTETTVTLSGAAFVHKENAISSDLVEATKSPETVTFTIDKQTFAVTKKDENITGLDEAIKGEDYTFTMVDYDCYTYNGIAVTVNGQTVTPTDNKDGTYIIPGTSVTGPIDITYTDRTAKTYNVSFDGTGASDMTGAANTATYNTDYEFTLPSATGYTYTMAGIKIKDTAFTGYTTSDKTYTIPGTAIKGDIVISVNKDADEGGISVSVSGTGAGAAEGYKDKVTAGQDYTLTLKKEPGYDYTVTATMGGKNATVIDNGNGTYTIKSVTGEIVFEVDMKLNVDGVSVEKYLSVDKNIMWLVTYTNTLEDKVPTYNGTNMFWSANYGTKDEETDAMSGAYCYLVVATSLNEETAKAAINAVDGEATAVEYKMDVNHTGKTDAADAQMAYNMYNALYETIANATDMAKFLTADTNFDMKVDSTDAQAIIAATVN